MIELITNIGLLLAVMYLLILLYLIIGIIRTKTELTDEQPFVSVIVAAHNEDQNIKACLDALLNQDYSQEKMEIIIVNDRSEDDTGLIVNNYEKNNTLIRVLTISDCILGLSPKKNAITHGINIGNGEIIAVIDADCRAPIQWLKRGVSYFTPETGMVVGLAPLNPTSWWMSPLMSLDAIVGGITAYGSLGWNHAVTCTGRNLFYRKKLFEEIGGFSGIDHILMGDDDLLMMKIRKQTDWKIRFMPDGNSAVLSDAPTGWRQFISQRSRHISASKYFPFSVKAGFGITFISKLFIMLFVVVLLVGNGRSHPNIALIIILPYLATFLLLIMMSIKVRQTSNILFYPLWEIYYLFNQLMIGPLGFFGQITWGKK